MKRMLWVCLLVLGLILSWTLVYAADFYVIPVQKGCTCKGTLVGTRWCANLDGTVTDLTTCLVWLRKANWGGTRQWEDCSTHNDANTQAGILCDGASEANLSDGSVAGDWRLPTKTELLGLTSEPEPVFYNAQRAFTNVQEAGYWSSNTYKYSTGRAWGVSLVNGSTGYPEKTVNYYVWPVRRGQ